MFQDEQMSNVRNGVYPLALFTHGRLFPFLILLTHPCHSKAKTKSFTRQVTHGTSTYPWLLQC